MGSNDSSPIMGDAVGLDVTSKPAPVGDGVIGASVPLPYVGDGVVLFVPESLPEDVGLGVVLFVPGSLPEDVGLGVTPPFSDCDIVGLGVVPPSDAVGAADTGGLVFGLGVVPPSDAVGAATGGSVVAVPESLPEDVGLGVTPSYSDCDIVGLGVVPPSDAVGGATGGSVTT